MRPKEIIVAFGALLPLVLKQGYLARGVFRTSNLSGDSS